MIDVDVLLAVAGVVVTLLTVAGMILLTPRGVEPAVHVEGTDPEGNVSPRHATDGPAVSVPA